MREELLSKEIETAQALAAREIAEARARLLDELENKNRDLEAFTYSVSHDLRAPLRAINGLTRLIIEGYGAQLPAGAMEYLGRVQSASQRMGQLIDALLELSRCGLAELERQPVDLSSLARAVMEDLAKSDATRKVHFQVEDGLVVDADPRLFRVMLVNLLGNAWKFTARTIEARVEIGARSRGGETVFFVRDNGVGFDAAYVRKLFQPFQRLHPSGEFPGAGIGLATVRRIVQRHGGEIRAESSPGQGAVFFFTLGLRPEDPAGPGPQAQECQSQTQLARLKPRQHAEACATRRSRRQTRREEVYASQRPS